MNAINKFFGNKEHNQLINAINNSQGVIYCDPESGIINQTNEFFSRLIGKPKEDIEGMCLQDLCESNEVSQEIASTLNSLNADTSIEFFMPLSGEKSGRWLALSFVPAVNEIGDVICVVVLAKDATNIKNKYDCDINKAIQSAALDDLSQNIMLVDNALNIKYLNASMISLMSSLSNDINMTSDVDLSDPLCALLNKNLQCLNFDDVISFTKNYSGRGSEFIDVCVGLKTLRLTLTPWSGDDNTPLGIALEWHDITQKISNDTITNNKIAHGEVMSSAINVCFSAMMLIDSNKKITFINQSLRDL